ncbi:MAG: hypothetical protein PHN80_12470 [Hespellia sp.]|nr:hypothetical protein [Hespellia sp.]
MRNFVKKHPALEDSLDTILSLLAGSFAMFAIIIVWIKEVISKNKDK